MDVSELFGQSHCADSGDQPHMKSAAAPLRITRLSTPFMDVIQPIVSDDPGTGGKLLTFPPYPALHDGKGGLSAHALAMVADLALSATIRFAIDGPPMATLGYRIDFLGELAELSDVEFSQGNAHETPRRAIVETNIRRSGSQTPLACVRGDFSVGLLPGGSGETGAGNWPEVVRKPWSSLADFLAIDFSGDVPAFTSHDHLVGVYRIPAFHGGVVAGVLGAVAENALEEAHGEGWRLANAEFRYLRPNVAFADPLTIATRIVKVGRSFATVEADSMQESKPCTIGRFCFERV